MKHTKKFIVDTITNILFWHPIFAIIEFFIFKLSIQELITTRAGNLVFALFLGGMYGQAIDLGRYLLNKKYYAETIKNIKRKTTNWKTNLQDTVVDILTTTVFWGGIMSLWMHYVGGIEWTKIGMIMLTTTIIFLFTSGIYGKVLNWSRKKFI